MSQISQIKFLIEFTEPTEGVLNKKDFHIKEI